VTRLRVGEPEDFKRNVQETTSIALTEQRI